MKNKDQLTQLENRDSFYKTLTEELNKANQFKTNVALLLVDIDRFHRFNEQYGYEVGDKLLIKFADVLRNVARDQDFIGRIGDNIFAILLTGILNEGHAELAARKIHRLLDVPFKLSNEDVSIECSISISLCPFHARDARHLLKIGENTLREAKDNGDKIRFAESLEDIIEFENWDFEVALSSALASDELSVFYQPKIDMKNKRVVGAEALLRWKSSDKGYIAPDVFIPLAEETGLIKPITNWLFNTALREAAEWPDKWGQQSVSVNVPPDFILSPDFTDVVQNAINLWGDEKTQLSIELIERSLVSQVGHTIEVLKGVQELGVDISIDDFGTGYSSLSYFKILPVNELKIDQSFIRNLIANEQDSKIVQLIIDLGHAFGLRVVAEGVEDKETAKLLHSMKCDIFQGYFFSKPLPQHEYISWLSSVDIK